MKILILLVSIGLAYGVPAANRAKRDLPIDWNITTSPPTSAPEPEPVVTEKEVVPTTEIVVVPEVVTRIEVVTDAQVEEETTTLCSDQDEVGPTAEPAAPVPVTTEEAREPEPIATTAAAAADDVVATTTGAPQPPVPVTTEQVVTTTQAATTTREATTTTQVPETTTTGGFVCPEPNGNFPDAVDCQQYYECKDGEPTHKVCGPKELFNSFPSKRKCDRPFFIDFSKCKVNDFWPFIPGK